ncbi:MAG: FmdB family transcriptional regulator, partial [Actinomycetota bacterium]|nr:FmdB family transcriptional regulator [Actinomycetota bacterium]
PLEVCPHCGGKLRKLYSPVGIVFKGSGFYSTESKKDSKAREDRSAAASSNKDKRGKKSEATDTSSAARSGTKEASHESGSRSDGQRDSGGRSEGKSAERSA